MKRILVIVVILYTQHAYSQANFRKAHLITNTGDTLTGFIDYREGSKNFKTCEFKKSIEGESVNYNPNQIKGYRFVNDKYFESREIKIDDDEVENVFLEVLVKGKVSLYKYMSKYYVGKDSLFYQLKNEQKEVEIEGRQLVKNTNEHIGILSYLLSDCMGLQSNIKGVRIDEKQLTKLIEKYNKCTGEPTITFKAKKPWFKATVGVGAGGVLSSIKFSPSIQGAEYLTSDFKNDYSLIVGSNFELSSPRLNERIAFYVGAYYLNSKYVSFNVQELSSYTVRNDVVINLKQLKVPFGFRYTLPEKNITPYFSLGASATLHLSTSSQWIAEIERNYVVETYENEALQINEYQIGYWGGIGAKKKINSRFSGKIELRYELTDGINTNESIVSSEIRNVFLLIGINF